MVLVADRTHGQCRQEDGNVDHVTGNGGSVQDGRDAKPLKAAVLITEVSVPAEALIVDEVVLMTESSGELMVVGVWTWQRVCKDMGFNYRPRWLRRF